MPTEHVLTLALDFDGSLVEDQVRPLRWRDRAKDFVLACSAAGIRLWLYSCRCTNAEAMERELPGDAEGFWRYGRVTDDLEYGWTLYEEMRAFLEAEGVWSLMTPWTSPGKPIADLYPDDRGERPDWLALSGELGLALGHADEGGARALGSPGDTPLGPSAGAINGIPASFPAGAASSGTAGAGVVVAPVGGVRPDPVGGGGV